MLQNAYLDAKIGVDPAENEPSKVSAPNLSVVRQYTESLADHRLERRTCVHGSKDDSRFRCCSNSGRIVLLQTLHQLLTTALMSNLE